MDPSAPDPLSDDEGPEGHRGESVDPESARREAEEALSEIEALADLDEAPEEAPPADPAEQAARPDADVSDETHCQNCGASLHGPYCAQCGQRAADRIVPLRHLFGEALEALFQLDLRVLHTLPTLFFLPGRLTREYLNGRRKRYVGPFRLYLLATILLFAVLTFSTTGAIGPFRAPQNALPTTTLDSTVAASGTPLFFGDPDQREWVARHLESDSVVLDVDLYEDPGANQQLEAFLRQRIAEALRHPQVFVSRLIERGPYLMFIMLPVFALLLKLLYLRRGRLYVEHLIFSLHVHTLAFFAFTIALLLAQSGMWGLQAAAPWVEAAPFLYLVLALQHVYEQSLLKSCLKTALLLLTYAGILLFGILLLLFAVLVFA